MPDQGGPEDTDSLVSELIDTCNDSSIQNAILSELTEEEDSLPVVEVSQVGWKEIIPRVIPRATAEQSKAVSDYIAEQLASGQVPGLPLDEGNL